MKDSLYSEERPHVEDFNFGEETVKVFDDMLDRSVPFYREIQRMVAELAVDFAVDGTNIYDLGCSTGNTFLAIDKVLSEDKKVRFVGVDYSEHMLEKAREKLVQAKFRHEFELIHRDLNQGIEVTDASVVLFLLTLQFVRPLFRDRLLTSICEGLLPNGCVILVEKVLGEHSTFNRLFIKHYYEMKKRHGYSDLEIAQKREALENVLIPYRLKENEELLLRSGFRSVDVFFKWYNFCAIIALK